MERLTIHNGMHSRLDPVQVEEIYKTLRAYEDTGMEPEDVEKAKEALGRTAIEITYYRKAEQEGRLIVLPCKVGSVLFHRTLGKGKVLEVYINRNGKLLFLLSFVGEFHVYSADDFGKNVFLNRSEAEKALEVSGDA